MAEVKNYQTHIIEIGSKIKNYRIKQNMTQQEMADISGVSMRSISRLEQGASVQLDSLIKILMALKLDSNIENLVPDLERKAISHHEKADKLRKRVRKFESEVGNKIKNKLKKVHDN